jgi:DDE superfamily endonuclease/Helix-turn-helix of DDE superfamily endonuclease
MNSVIEYITKNPQETKRLIGINYDQLQQLITQAVALEEQNIAINEEGKIRIIKQGGGRKPKLSVSEQILLTLVYLHHLPTFQMLGVQFGVSESTAHNLFHYWSKIFREILPASLLEQIKKNEQDWEWVKEMLLSWELVVDSSEQARERPKEYQEQKKFYSGKKKNHTLKNQLIVLPSGAEIVDVTVGEPGPSSDINLFRARQAEFAAHQKFKGDKGYIGEVQIDTPHKKKKKQELTLEQKEENKQLSAQRIVVEHVIRLVKIFRVAQERFRLRPKNYEQVILTVGGAS